MHSTPPRRFRRHGFHLILALSLFSILFPTAFAAPQSSRPNFLIIMTDDQRFDTMDYMPRTKARIFDQGITFTNAYVTTPLCCPSRASTLTGLYAHNHDVRDNGYPLSDSTFMQFLHDNGYYTGLVGKYLGYWTGEPRPEFDYWASFRGTTAPYFDPELNINGKKGVVKGYITHLFRDYAVDFLDQAANQDKPFALIVTPNAPHEPAEPAPEDAKLYPNLEPLRRPNFDEKDVTDKSLYFQSISSLSKRMIEETDRTRRKQLQTLNSVDKMVDRILSQLEAQGTLDNTLVLFMSDNGFMWGEHGRVMKKMPYEESVKVPFAIRYPRLIKTPHIDDRIVGNVDIAPTIYELAGIDKPYVQDGRSLLPLLSDTPGQPTGTDGASTEPVKWNRQLYLEAWNSRPWRAVRYDRYMLIDFRWDRPELYDLVDDPYQLTNLAANPEYTIVLADMKRRLLRDAEVVIPGDDTNFTVTFDGWVPTASGVEEGWFSADTAGQTVTYTSPIASTSIALIATRGPTGGKAQVSIDGKKKQLIDLYSPVEVKDVVFNFDRLKLRAHKMTVRVLGKNNPDSTGTTVTIQGFKVGDIPVPANNPDVMYAQWEMTTNAGMDTVGGSAHRTDTAGATATFTFTGTQVTWITTRGPKFGKAKIFIDGTEIKTVDMYAPKHSWQHKEVIDGLTPGTHTIKILVVGKHQSKSAGNVVYVDGFSVP